MKRNRNMNGKKMTVKATAYCDKGLTYMGTKCRDGVIAVDPRIIPLGTKVYIPQFNKVFTAEDTGGAIKGNKIDIWMAQYKTCMDWGIRTIDIIILD